MITTISGLLLFGGITYGLHLFIANGYLYKDTPDTTKTAKNNADSRPRRDNGTFKRQILVKHGDKVVDKIYTDSYKLKHPAGQ